MTPLPRRTCFLCGATLVANSEADAQRAMDAHGVFAHDLPERKQERAA